MNERRNLLVSYLAEGEGVRTAVYSSGTLSELLGYDINNLGRSPASLTIASFCTRTAR